mgnify:CR=1 FL=1|jgi:hypothetical protein
MDELAIGVTKNVVTVGGRQFVILPPTPRDMIATAQRMKELAQAQYRSPLEYVLSHAALPPAAMALAVAEAIKLGSGKALKPTPEEVYDQYVTLDGVRWRLWHHASQTTPGLTLEDVAALVPDGEHLRAVEALDAALSFKELDPNAPAPATGSA